jgi:hypothetical protein
MNKAPAYKPKKKDTERVTPCRAVLEINAQIARKHLTLHEVAKAAGVNYWTLSALLNGRVSRPKHLPTIRQAVASFPTP